MAHCWKVSASNRPHRWGAPEEYAGTKQFKLIPFRLYPILLWRLIEKQGTCAGGTHLHLIYKNSALIYESTHLDFLWSYTVKKQGGRNPAGVPGHPAMKQCNGEYFCFTGWFLEAIRG
jgi:hypothetical protein